MKNLIFISAVIFVGSLCVFDNVFYSRFSKEKMKESWAWKIFIFTDEGEYIPTDEIKNNFDDTVNVNTIFAEDVLEVYSNEYLFVNNQNESFKTR